MLLLFNSVSIFESLTLGLLFRRRGVTNIPLPLASSSLHNKTDEVTTCSSQGGEDEENITMVASSGEVLARVRKKDNGPHEAPVQASQIILDNIRQSKKPCSTSLRVKDNLAPKQTNNLNLGIDRSSPPHCRGKRTRRFQQRS